MRNATALTMSADASIGAAETALSRLQLTPPSRDTDVISAAGALPDHFTVAIVVPAHNDHRFLVNALESVRRQTYPHWRCYIVDDASTTPVDAVVAGFVRRDNRFVSLRHGTNGGLSAARNTGLILAQEHLIQFLDADDMLTPWAIERRVDTMRQHWTNAAVAGAYGYVAQCTAETTTADLRRWRRSPTLGRADWLSSDGECPFNVHAPLIRTELLRLLGGFDESFVNGAEDWELWHRVLRHGYWFEPTQCIVGAYRQRQSSMIRNRSQVHAQRANQLYAFADAWVDVDRSLAATDATMPIDVAASAMRRARRVAVICGMRFGARPGEGDVVDSEVVALLGGGSLPDSRRNEIRESARRGVFRGLGLSVEVANRLSTTALQQIDAASHAIADDVFARLGIDTQDSPDRLPLGHRVDAPVGLIAETIADIDVLRTAARDRFGENVSVVAIDVDTIKGTEGAAQGWMDRSIETVSANEVQLGRCRFGNILVRGPLSPATTEVLDRAESDGAVVEYLDEEQRGLTICVDDDDPRVIRPDLTFSQLLALEEAAVDPDDDGTLRELRHAHLDQTAVIIGNGPSFNDTPLALLRGHTTFGVNSIFLAADRLPEPITYYVVEDQAVFRDNLEQIKRFEAETRLFPTHYRASFDAVDLDGNTHFFRMNTGFYGRGTGTYCLPRFSFDPTQRLFCGQSVTLLNLQLAHWMGFRRVVLIGMDFSYTVPVEAEQRGDVIVSRSDDPNHFDPRYFGPGKTWHAPKLDRVLASYRLAGEIYQATGREIINATVGGKLEVFPRLPLEAALRGDPVGA